MKKITKWYKLAVNEEGIVTSMSFNHYEDGWVLDTYPQPFDNSFSNQVAWKKDKWIKQFAYMDEHNKILEIGVDL